MSVKGGIIYVLNSSNNALRAWTGDSDWRKISYANDFMWTKFQRTMLSVGSCELHTDSVFIRFGIFMIQVCELNWLTW